MDPVMQPIWHMYEFYGCYYHGCCYCYEGEGASYRHRKYIDKKGKEQTALIKYGELYMCTLTSIKELNGSEMLDISLLKCWNAGCPCEEVGD